MNGATSPWTKTRIDELTRRWTDGESAREIAIAMGVPTRNAIIGKVYRLHLPKREKPAIPQIVLDTTASKTCQFPHGHVGDPDFHFCGAPGMPGSAYCAAHYLATHTNSSYSSKSPLRELAEETLGFAV